MSERVTVITDDGHGRRITAEVNRFILAERLRHESEVAKMLGLRPGQIISGTIFSTDKYATLDVIGNSKQ